MNFILRAIAKRLDFFFFIRTDLVQFLSRESGYTYVPHDPHALSHVHITCCQLSDVIEATIRASKHKFARETHID